MHAGHEIETCRCGKVIRQCRCAFKGDHQKRVVQESCDDCKNQLFLHEERKGVLVVHSWQAAFEGEGAKFVVKGAPGSSKVTIHIGGTHFQAEKEKLKEFFDAIARQP